MRFRQENVHNDRVIQQRSRDKDRQRIRARLGAYTQINPQVDTGIRIATGNNDDARSTNQSLDNYFDKKQIWLDQGYVDYHPDAIKNLHIDRRQDATAMGEHGRRDLGWRHQP